MKFNEMMIGNEAAFDPFYDEDIVVELKGGQRVAVKACVTTDNTVSPISEEMMDTETQSISVCFRRSDWPMLGSIKRGDKIMRTLWNGQPQTYSVSEVRQDFALGWQVIANEV